MEEKELVLLVKQVLTHIADENKKLYDVLGKMQIEHFKQLEKQSETFINSIEKIITSQKEEQEKIAFQPIPLDSTAQENTIEKTEQEEVPLSETNRIPIVEGVNVKFEDEEQIFPINITGSQE
jgi:hypothetical protein